ncbi:MAG: hypothetical protein KDK76_01165 [Chlamydiia bacterium]|nr:hypothetical protein [Chlamydiia bacterium]
MINNKVENATAALTFLALGCAGSFLVKQGIAIAPSAKKVLLEISSGPLSVGLLTGAATFAHTPCSKLAVQTCCDKQQGKKAVFISTALYGVLPFTLNALFIRTIQKKITLSPMTRLGVIAHSALGAISSLALVWKRKREDFAHSFEYLKSAPPVEEEGEVLHLEAGGPLTGEQMKAFWEEQPSRQSDHDYIINHLEDYTPSQLAQLIQFERRYPFNSIRYVGEGDLYLGKKENKIIADIYLALPEQLQTPENKKTLGLEVEKLIPLTEGEIQRFWYMNQRFFQDDHDLSDKQFSQLFLSPSANDPIGKLNSCWKNEGYCRRPGELLVKIYLSLPEEIRTDEAWKSLEPRFQEAINRQKLIDAGIGPFYNRYASKKFSKKDLAFSVVAGLGASTLAVASYLALKTLQLLKQHYPTIKGTLPVAAVMGVTYQGVQWAKINPDHKDKIGVAFSILTGAVLTPKLSTFLFEKRITYLTSASYSLLGGALFSFHLWSRRDENRRLIMMEDHGEFEYCLQ